MTGVQTCALPILLFISLSFTSVLLTKRKVLRLDQQNQQLKYIHYPYFFGAEDFSFLVDFKNVESINLSRRITGTSEFNNVEYYVKIVVTKISKSWGIRTKVC